jgi:hypothetical protein
VRDLALSINPNVEFWSIGRVSAYIIGNHELDEIDCRWKDPDPNPLETLTFIHKCSLINLLESFHLTNAEAHPKLGVSYNQVVVKKKADIFISFAYSSNYIELVDALECFLADNPSLDRLKVGFWFDLFVNCQWDALSHDFDWWSTTFREAVQDIGHTLCFLYPWNDPVMLNRAWCLYEISCSKKLSIAMSHKQITDFRETLINTRTRHTIEMSLCKIDLEKSDAYVKVN